MITKVNKCLNLCVSIAVILIALIFPPTPALSEEPYVFERMWPTLQQPWYFNPAGIATDKNGNIYVINFAYISTIKKFSADGQFITEWGESGTGNGQFRQPTAIEIGGNGNVYVVDAGNHRIQKFTSDGQFISKWGGEGSNNGQFKLNSPSASDYCYEGGISIGPNNNVYVADTFNHRIQKFNSNGLFISAWGSEGLDDGQFDQPIGIAVDRSGNVYVVDAGNHRIQKFTSDGQFLTKWGSTGSGDGEFDFKGGECILGRISTDESGNIYVSDHNNHRIQKFTSDGRFITKWGEFGSGDGELIYPTGITTDGKNNIYVCDGNNFRIQKFTSNGQFITKWGSTGSGDGEFFYPSGITVDGGNNVYVADTGNGRIQKFASDGRFITKWDAGCSVGIAVSKSGYVYVADSCNHCIQKFTSDGQFTTKWGSEGSADGEFNFGNHYIGMAIDGNGNIYVVDFGNHCIQKFTSDGRFIAKWGSEGSADGEFNFGNYLHPSGVGVAVDENDYVYVADRVNHRVQKFTSDGQFITKWGNEGSADGESWYPIAIAIDKSENVYVVDENNRIQVFTSDGQFITKFGEFGSTAGQLAAPFGICVSASNRVYVADTLNARIQVFSRKDDTIKISKAIIVAGGGPFIGNNIWDATEMCANYAYRALTYQGFTKDTIYYLSSDTDLDLDGNGILDDVDGDATNTNFQSAIITWALDTDNLFIYMVGHGGDGTFRIGELELLKAKDLDTWIDTLQNTIPGTVTLLYDACRSGSFLSILDPPSGRERILATSASSDEEAIFGSRGTISFSFLFWARMFNGDSLYDSFYHATNSIGVTYPQHPLLEGNGNGIGNEKEDKDIVRVLTIGNETKSAGDIPVIGSVSPAQTLDGLTSALIYADNVIDADGISRVWAVITPPDYSPGSPDNPVTDLPLLDLTLKGDSRYEGTYNNFTSVGTYTIAIYASDRRSVISLPKSTTVTVSRDYDSDIYEEDDTFSQANVINLNGDPQRHNFHKAGDRDWVKFYGIAEEIYEIEVINLGDHCDAVIELYDTDGATLLKGPWNWGVEGEDELMNWRCTQDGIYYVMIRQYDPSVFGDNTKYDLKVFRPTAPFPGFITGAITDAYSGGSIGGAIIRSDNNATAISLDDGAYLLVHPAGTFSLSAQKSGYTPANYPGVEVSEGGTTTRYFILAPLSNGNDSDGDVAPLGNRDGTVNVGDALVALRFALLLETPTQEDIEHGDVAPLDAQGQPNPDGVINVGDALVILRKALGIIGF